ncbi:MAG: replication-associated recombination protein A [Aquiluna sp.]
MPTPLAERLRPQQISELIGQQHLLAKGSAISNFLSGDSSSWASVILWGPPGSGKTSIARIIGEHSGAKYQELSAISSSVSEVREVIEAAKRELSSFEKPTILFLDEIHRFSKAQQDSLLGAVESGVITLVAATTENPSFSVIKPLISRSLVLQLEPLTTEGVLELLNRAVAQDKAFEGVKVAKEALDYLAEISSGDARRALNLLEAAANGGKSITLDLAKAASKNAIAFDAKGNVHYDTISAFIKSVRGSDVDSALHYLARMIEGGEDPRFIARRLMILASEDIGLADPQAMVLAEACAGVVERIGMPEGRIPLSELTIYLALAPKSNRAYEAIDRALEDVRNSRLDPIPAQLRSTGAVGYQYPHDNPAGIVKQEYSSKSDFYSPSQHGLEARIGERWLAIKKILRGDDKES